MKVARAIGVWLACVGSAGLLAAAAGLGVVYGGIYDVRASRPHYWPMAWLTRTTMTWSDRRLARTIAAPSSFSAAQAQAGAQLYAQRCAACHGGPGLGRAAWASGLTPSPPYLLDAAHKWSAAQLFVIVHDGVKMTAMPAWGEAEPPARIWAVVAFLEALPGLSAADYQQLTAPRPGTDLLQPPHRATPG